MSAWEDYTRAWEERDPEGYAEHLRRVAEIHDFLENLPQPTQEETAMFMDHIHDPEHCPNGPHRGPAGPNEDLSQCGRCLSIDHSMRPEGETYGWHLKDCSLPLRHENECIGGGAGHPIPSGEKIRGYFPPIGFHGTNGVQD